MENISEERRMRMETRVKLMIQAKPENEAGWPHINFNYSQLADRLLEAFKKRMPEVRFDACISSDAEAARKGFAEEKEKYDGLVLITATNAPSLHKIYCDLANTDFPILIADLPHGGSGAFLSAASRVEKEKLPIGLVSAMDFSEIAENVQLIEVLKKLKQERLLIISDNPENTMFSPAKLKGMKERWGCDAVIRDSSEVLKLYETWPEKDAVPLAEKWLKQSIRSIEPTGEEIIKSAKLYGCLEEMKKRTGCTAVTVDCLSLFYNKRMKAYPCLAFFEMLNQGKVGICEADVDSVLSVLISVYGMNRPGFVSDPSIDTSSGQIIYDHCVCSSRMEGYDRGERSEYYIRSHAEDQKGASVQTLLPLNRPLTTYKFSTEHNALAVHTAVAVGNVGLDRGCRTKLAAESNVRSIMRNWNMDIFGWHRVTVYGDWREKLLNLARMKGMDVYEEDRMGSV